MATKKTAGRQPTQRKRRSRGEAKEAEARITRMLSTLDKQLEERFEHLFVRLIWRLGLASQKDVGGLSQRINDLERRLRTRRPTTRLQAVRRKPLAPSSAEGGSPSSGNSAA